MDVLSDVLSAVRMTGAIYFDVDAGAPWVGESPGAMTIAGTVMPGAEHVISFHAVLSGSCWAAISGENTSPLLLNEGDVVVFPTGAANVMSSAPGARGEPNMAIYYRPVHQSLPFSLTQGGDSPERTRFICGYLGCDRHPFNPLLAALPPILSARPESNGDRWVIDFFRRAVTEGNSGRAGGETVLAKISELMFVEVIRNYIEGLPEDARGWLSGLRDAKVGEALRLIHARPAENWTLCNLARAVGMSRSTFAERFQNYVEISPMQYLARWRLQLASRMLERPGASVAQVGADVGYESEAAFNRAFKKLVGTPPGAWRKTRGHLAGVPGVVSEAGVAPDA